MFVVLSVETNVGEMFDFNDITGRTPKVLLDAPPFEYQIYHTVTFPSIYCNTKSPASTTITTIMLVKKL